MSLLVMVKVTVYVVMELTYRAWAETLAAVIAPTVQVRLVIDLVYIA